MKGDQKGKRYSSHYEEIVVFFVYFDHLYVKGSCKRSVSFINVFYTDMKHSWLHV